MLIHTYEALHVIMKVSTASLFERFFSVHVKVKWWITINEPSLASLGYSDIKFAPSLNLESSSNYIAIHNMLKAHGRIFRLYNEKYRSTQNGKKKINLKRSLQLIELIISTQ